jgi:hypothetical protein
MLLKPCLHCPFRNDCEIRADLRKRAKGLPFTTVNFKCAKRETSWRIGQRVRATFRVMSTGGSDYRYYDETFSGAVVGWKKNKVVVWLDDPLDEDGKRQIVKLWPDRPDLKPLDEADAVLCKECRRPEGREQVQSWVCRTCDELDEDWQPKAN